MNGKRVPHARELLALEVRLDVLAEADREHDGVDAGLDLGKRRRRVDGEAEAKVDTELLEHPCLGRERLAELAVRRDREAHEPTRLVALVVRGDGVTEAGELSGAGETGRAAADHRHAEARRCGPRKREAFGERPVGGMPLESPDLDRAPTLVVEDACALTENLGRAGARARAAEKVLGEDRGRRVTRVLPRDSRDERGNVDAGRARDGARRFGVRTAAFETAVGFENRLRVGQWSGFLERVSWSEDRNHGLSVAALPRERISDLADVGRG